MIRVFIVIPDLLTQFPKGTVRVPWGQELCLPSQSTGKSINVPMK